METKTVKIKNFVEPFQIDGFYTNLTQRTVVSGEQHEFRLLNFECAVSRFLCVFSSTVIESRTLIAHGFLAFTFITWNRITI